MADETAKGRDERFQDRVRRRVRIADLIREPLEIELPDGREVVVQDLGVDDMIRLFEIEGRVSEAKGGDEIRVMAESRDFVCDLIERENPDVFMETVEVDGETERRRVLPNWPLQVIMALTGAISGNDSVAEEIRSALLGDESERAAEDELRDQERAAAAERGELDPEDEPEASADDPLTLTQRSPTPSSNSGATSDGDRNGGSDPDSPGESSKHTSGISGAAV